MKNIISIMILFNCSLAAAGSLSSNEQNSHEKAREYRGIASQIAQHGLCNSDDLEIKMQNILKIKNRVIYAQNPKSLWHSAKLNGQKIEFFDTEDRLIISQNLHYEIKDADIIDIRLSFAIYQEQVVLYWEETYENRSKQLGLMNFTLKHHKDVNIAKPEFVEICRGSKGSTSSH